MNLTDKIYSVEYQTVKMANEVLESQMQQFLKGIKIPPQPRIIVELQTEMAKPNVTLAKLSEIISKDVGLSGCVLKVVNSPFFGLRNQITSIKQALNILGFNNIINIANSISVRESLSDSAIFEMTQFWDNASDVAIASAMFTNFVGNGNSDEAYTLGLFHNTGVPLLMSKFAEYPSILKNAYAEPSTHITDIENQLITTNHSIVGYYVAKAWKLPEYLCEVIAEHHKADAIFSDNIKCDVQTKNMLAILKLAETTCKTHKTIGSCNADYEFNRIKDNILIHLGISEYDLENWQAEIIDALASNY
jgi:HD-like signal output (HDOD) protein